MKSAIILLAILSIYHCNGASNEDKSFAASCYVCGIDDTLCQDPFDEAKGSKVACSVIADRKLQPEQINSVSNSTKVRRQAVPFDKYKCVKLLKAHNGVEKVERTCYKFDDPEHVKNICTFIREDDGTVQDCHVCHSDNCNGATTLTFTSVVGIISFSALYLNRFY